MVEAGLAEMHLRVDDARQDVQAPAVDLPPAEACERSPIAAIRPRADADVALDASVMVHDGAALEDQVEGLGHGNLIP